VVGCAKNDAYAWDSHPLQPLRCTGDRGVCTAGRRGGRNEYPQLHDD